MHPDDAVDLALQDLRSLTRTDATVVPRAPESGSPLLAAWRRWMDGWKWYASADLTPPAAEPAFPMQRMTAPAPLARTAAVKAPCVHHPLELLFGGAVAAECR